MDIITVYCKLSLNESESGLRAITFKFEDIPFVIYSHNLYEYGVVDDELKKLNFHINDDDTILSVYDLKIFDRTGRFAAITTEKYESSWDRTERIKRELVYPDVKLSAPRDIFMKFIKDTDASLNRAELQRLYPVEFAQWMNGDRPESSPVSIIYAKKDRMFTRSGATGATGLQGLQGATGATGLQGLQGATGAIGAGRRKNGRRCRRTRQKTKRVKRAKLMKRSRKANHIKNVKH
jgi:hypothetical protein